MSIPVRPATLIATALAVAGAASGVTVLVLREGAACAATAAGSSSGAPGSPGTDADRDAVTRRALRRQGNAAAGGRSF